MSLPADGRGPLTLLEYGGCRAKDGGLGVYSTKKATMGQCRTHCEADPGCFAMQYQDVECRLYTQPIAMTTGAPSPLVCWTYTAGDSRSAPPAFPLPG